MSSCTALSFEAHISNVTRSLYFYLCNISCPSLTLTPTCTAIIVNTLIPSHPDNCHSLLFGFPWKSLHKLWMVQNVATRTLSIEHVTPALQQLCWLPIKSRSDFKILLLIFMIVSSELCHIYTPSRILRSSSAIQLFALSAILTRAFSWSAFRLWSSLPPDIRTSDTVPTFRSRLKTHLFRVAYSVSD